MLGVLAGRGRDDVRTPLISQGAHYSCPSPGQAVAYAHPNAPAPVQYYDAKLPPASSNAAPDPEVAVVPADVVIGALHRMARQQGDANQIPSIAALLGQGVGARARSSQPLEVRIAAVEALRALVPAFPQSWPGMQQLLEVLRTVALRDHYEDARCASLRVLREVGQRGDGASIAVCRGVLEDGRASADLRLQAADTLQALVVRGEARSMRAALVALKDADCTVRNGGLNILRRICTPGDESDENMVFLKELAAVATRHAEAEARAGAVEVMAQAEGEGGAFGTKVALMCLHDFEEEVQQQALSALRRMWKKGDPEAVSTLAGVLKSSQNQELRGLALNVLVSVASRGDPSAVSVSIRLLADENSSVQAAAAQALKQLCARGDPSAVDELFALLSHDEEEVRRLAVELLGVAATRSNTEVIRALEQLCDGADPGLHMAAEQSLRQIR